MPIDPALAVGAELPEREVTWTASDVLLYHLALGAGADPTHPREMRYTYERDLRVLPTFALVLPTLRATAPPELVMPGITLDLSRVLHGGQELTVHREIPASGRATARTRIADVYDKGHAAVIVQETQLVGDDGAPYATTRSSIFARGEGSFGGDRGPSDRVAVPDRAPDETLDVPTLPQQALLYRLCGDRNPLHADPEFAAKSGFDAPILHGLCTYAMVCKAVIDTMLAGDVSRVSGYSTRFAGVMFPGETLRIHIWVEGDRLILATSVTERDDAPVLSDTVLSLHRDSLERWQS